MDDQNTPSEPVVETPVPEPVSAPAAEPPITPNEPNSSQSDGSKPSDLPPEAPESPINDVASLPVESANSGLKQPESEALEAPNQAPISEPTLSTQSKPASPAPAPVTPPAPQPQPQSPAQQDQKGFIHNLLLKAQAKIQSNRQKKLELLMLAVSKKGNIDNREAQKLLRISDKTAERYLNKLVAQGRLKRSGAGRDVIYMLLR